MDFLTFQQRQTIEQMHALDEPPAKIALAVGVSLTTIYRELKKGDTGDRDPINRIIYSAELAERRARENSRRRGRKKKEATHEKKA